MLRRLCCYGHDGHALMDIRGGGSRCIGTVGRPEGRGSSPCNLQSGDVCKSHVTVQEFGREVAREQEQHEVVRFFHRFCWTE